MKNLLLLFFLVALFSGWNSSFAIPYLPGKLVFDPVCYSRPYWIEAKMIIENDDASIDLPPYFKIDPNPGSADFCVNENVYHVGDLLYEEFCGLAHKPVFKVTFYLRTCTEDAKSGWSNPASLDRDTYYEDWIGASYITGDANGDGNISIADAICLLNFLFGDDSKVISPYYADFNQDSKLDLADVLAILNYISDNSQLNIPV